MSFKSSFK